MGRKVDGLDRCGVTGPWTRHVVRVCRSRLARSLARASKGVMHVWARPLGCVLLADALQGRPAGEGKCGGTGSVLEITDIITLHTGPLGG